MDVTRLMARPSDQFDVDSQTNAVATASLAAPTSPKCNIIHGISISASAAPGAAVTVQVLNGATVIKQYEIPANAFAPIDISFRNGLKCAPGVIASVTCSAGGAGVVTTACIRGIVATE